MSDQQTAEQTMARLERKLESLQRDGQFTAVRNELTDIDTRIGALPGALATMRSRGYQFHNYLEARAEALAERWPDQRDQAQREMRRAVAEMRDEISQTADAVQRSQGLRSRPLAAAKPSLDRVDRDLDAAARRVKARADAITGGYRASRDEARALEREIKDCVDLLDLIGTASFRLLPDEAPIAEVRGKWLEDEDKRGPDGRLYVTDCRVLFEQHEDVATRKVLFVTTRRETVRKLMWEAPASAIADAGTSQVRRGLVMRRDLLRLEFNPPATVRSAVVQLRDDAAKWEALISRVASGEVDHERVGATAEGEAGGAPRAQAATYIVPAKCPTCGGGMDSAGLIRGVAAVPCAYCGVMVTLERAQ